MADQPTTTNLSTSPHDLFNLACSVESGGMDVGIVARSIAQFLQDPQQPLRPWEQELILFLANHLQDIGLKIDKDAERLYDVAYGRRQAA